MQYSLYLFTAITIVISLAKSSPARCPLHICKCNRKENSAYCSGRGDHLTHIPKMPSYVRKLQLEEFNLSSISKKTFALISQNNITSISVQRSNVHNVDRNTFETLGHLTSLDLSSNKNINISSLKQSFTSLKKKNLYMLSFQNMGWKDLTMNIFSGVRRHVVKLYLSGNLLEKLSEGMFEGLDTLTQLYANGNKLNTCDASLNELEKLHKLDLSSNYISTCNSLFLPKTLQMLKLQSNHLMYIPEFCSANRSSNLPRLWSLNLQNNFIFSITNISFDCLPLLKVLNIGQNTIKTIPSKAFLILPKLETLNLKDIQVQKVDRDAFIVPTLKQLIFARNFFGFTDKGVAQKASFSKLTNLELLDLSYNHLPMSIEGSKYLLAGLRKLKILVLKKVYWNSIPDTFFALFPNLEQITLSDNEITKLNQSLFSNDSIIREMLVDSNHIAHIGQDTFTSQFWHRIERIDLSANPFSCDCELLWFRDKLRNSSTKFRKFQKYKCSSPPERKDLPLTKFNLTFNDCKPKSELLAILVASGCSCLVVIIFILSVYKGRWHIRYWIYLLRYRRSDYRRLGDVEFRFDAFIIYSDGDSAFVHNILLPKLEEEEQLRLCVHFRDFEIGKIIADNIVDNMNKSRMAIVVLSKHFCKSKWCKFELIIAQDRWLNNESEALLLVMLEDIQSNHMTPDLRALIRTTTYAMWTDDNQGQRLFWDQIRTTLRRGN